MCKRAQIENEDMKKTGQRRLYCLCFCMNETFIIARKSCRKQVILENEKRTSSPFNDRDNAYY